MMTLNIADTATENALLTGEGSGRIPPEYPDEAMPVTAGTGSLPSGADVDLMSAQCFQERWLAAICCGPTIGCVATKAPPGSMA